MNIQKKAFQLIYDIIGIILRWDKNQLSDKEAMSQIVDILASDTQNDEELVQKIEKKKSNFLQQKLNPLVIGAVSIVILFMAITPFIGILDNENTMPDEEPKIVFEQMEEMQSDVEEKIQNRTVIEEFENITGLNEG